MRVTIGVGLAVLEPDGEGLELRRELACRVDAAVGNDHAAQTIRAQVTGGERGGVAGTDEQRGALLETGEHGVGHRHRRGRDRHRVGADVCLGPHTLGHRERRLEQAVEHRSGAAGLLRRAIGVLELAQDLRLAEDHRVETGRDAKGVRDRGALVEPVQTVLYTRTEPVIML